jgi:hypothetical protein
MMTRPAVFTMLPSDFHFKAVLWTNPYFSRSLLKGAMTCVEAETCMRSDSVKNISRTFLSTNTPPH